MVAEEMVALPQRHWFKGMGSLVRGSVWSWCRIKRAAKKERGVLVHTPPVLGSVMRGSSYLGEGKGIKSRL